MKSMMDSSTNTNDSLICARVASPTERTCIIANAIALSVLIIPAIICNTSILIQYCCFQITRRHNIVNFVIFLQAAVNTVHVVIVCPGLIIGSLIFYTDVFGVSPVEPNSVRLTGFYQNSLVEPTSTGIQVFMRRA